MSNDKKAEAIDDVRAQLETALYVYTKVFHAIDNWGITDQAIFMISDEIHSAVPEIKQKDKPGALQKLSSYMESFRSRLGELQDVQP